MKTHCPKCKFSYEITRESFGHSMECVSCGHTFTIQPGARKLSLRSQPKKECPLCEKTIDASAPECPHCGYDFSKGIEQIDNARDCPQCGHKMVPERVVCIECGYHIRKKRQITTQTKAPDPSAGRLQQEGDVPEDYSFGEFVVNALRLDQVTRDVMKAISMTTAFYVVMCILLVAAHGFLVYKYGPFGVWMMLLLPIEQFLLQVFCAGGIYRYFLALCEQFARDLRVMELRKWPNMKAGWAFIGLGLWVQFVAAAATLLASRLGLPSWVGSTGHAAVTLLVFPISFLSLAMAGGWGGLNPVRALSWMIYLFPRYLPVALLFCAQGALVLGIPLFVAAGLPPILGLEPDSFGSVICYVFAALIFTAGLIHFGTSAARALGMFYFNRRLAMERAGSGMAAARFTARALLLGIVAVYLTSAVHFVQTTGQEWLDQAVQLGEVMDLQREIALATQEIQQEPNAPKFHVDRADALRRLAQALPASQPEEREETLRKAFDDTAQAIKLDPGYAEAWAVQAQVFLESGQRERAENSARKALKLEPANARAREVLATTRGEPKDQPDPEDARETE